MARSGPASLAEAISLAQRDLPNARVAIKRLRRSALRLGDQRQAEACLVALRLVANASGDEAEEARIAAKLAAERGDWFDLYWLGRVNERQGRVSRAVSLYEKSLRECPNDDPDRDLVASALAALTKETS